MGRLFNIQAALETKLNGVAGKPTILWENEKAESLAVGSSYWRPTIIAIEGDCVQTDMLLLEKGFMQVDIFVPREEGLATLLTYMDSISSAFNIAAPLVAGNTEVDIIKVNRGSRIDQDDNGFCKGRIDIYYEAYAY